MVDKTKVQHMFAVLSIKNKPTISKAGGRNKVLGLFFYKTGEKCKYVLTK